MTLQAFDTLASPSRGQTVKADPLWRSAVTELTQIYGDHSGFARCLEDMAIRIGRARFERPAELAALDAARSERPDWYLRPGRPAYCTYIDRFAGTLRGTIRHLDHLKDLNIGIFHPLPLLKPREGDSDGGFAVADYGDVDPRLGTMDDLRDLAAELRARDMSLVIDMVCNHTAREHPWAQKMLAADPDFADFYIVLEDRAEVDAWEVALQDVFPGTAPGSFTYDAPAGGWVWTTFYPFQWDLNYANPRVFVEMLDSLLYLANAGVEGFRLDSTAFLWKQKGTICRNLPQTHNILRALRCLVSLVAPSVFLLAEAIESQASVLPFFGTPQARECDLAYNNGVMTALWGAMADQKSDVLGAVITRAGEKPAHGHWLNYVRCHDDIIWLALADTVPMARLKAWSDFFGGQASYARGLAFQAPDGFPASGCGMAASLCGGLDDPQAVARLKMLYGITYALEGIPLLYMGDEIGLENFESFRDDPALRDELRWLHRPEMDWAAAAQALEPSSPRAGILGYLQKLSALLMRLDILPGQTVKSTGRDAVLTFERPMASGCFVCEANLSDVAIDLLCSGDILTGDRSVLPPYGVRWSMRAL
ncbi:alpha-amylase family glycosyl hydrolase [Asticcacaulis sp. AC402]|uniref:alpha-amylase family glycosyl hydrolase n=1 Tax=Asticcacaulis sp. AC402 TaxID=1282361 RepID=UPI0003C3EA41|nr:alpha-amylase family glycosyl hydrolase [Asticcacaulis sp. AC402]ESQ74187.1 alpha-amylase [Asticcacaulis sp. AC402]